MWVDSPKHRATAAVATRPAAKHMKAHRSAGTEVQRSVPVRICKSVTSDKSLSLLNINKPGTSKNGFIRPVPVTQEFIVVVVTSLHSTEADTIFVYGLYNRVVTLKSWC